MSEAVIAQKNPYVVDVEEGKKYARLKKRGC